ncbi:MAG: type II secretion system protein GspK [Pseudoxanthomonas suwonensis]|nr:type II secretion system protein GspK [Pseudoxanthomonas suwonensis]
MSSGMVTAGCRQNGAALLLVLWLVALLAALIGAFAFAARTEQLLGRATVDAAVAQQAARAGLDYALSRTGQAGEAHVWWPDGRANVLQLGAIHVEVALVDEQGKVDLNQASHMLIAGLLRALDAEQPQVLAGVIVDWRDEDSLTQPAGGAEDGDYAAAGRPYGAKDAPFESITELQQLLGMTPELYARLAPNVTVHSRNPDPDPTFAPPAVLTALGLDAAGIGARRAAWRPGPDAPPVVPGAVGRVGGTFGIVSRARLPHGYEGTLRAVVRTGPGGLPGAAYTVLSWEEGSLLR